MDKRTPLEELAEAVWLDEYERGFELAEQEGDS